MSDSISCTSAVVVAKILQIYFVILIIYAVVSWIPNIRGRWSDYVAMLVEPVLEPVRRIIPPIGGFDIAFLVVIIGIQWLSSNLPGLVCRPY